MVSAIYSCLQQQFLELLLSLQVDFQSSVFTNPRQNSLELQIMDAQAKSFSNMKNIHQHLLKSFFFQVFITVWAPGSAVLLFL